MVQAWGTLVQLQWRRIPFICGIAIGLFLYCSCNDFIPDQDAVIMVDATKDSTHQYINSSFIKIYDTNLSTLTCQLSIQNGEKVQDKDIYLHQGKTIIKKGQTINGAVDFGWLNKGTYSIQIGHTDKYPCLKIYSIEIPSGKGCEIAIKLPRNH